jgi:hypothetical protein
MECAGAGAGRKTNVFPPRRAFAGQLARPDPAGEPAEKLLERIRVSTKTNQIERKIMASDYVICVRDVSEGSFTDDPGTTRYLELPEDTAANTPDNPLSPTQAINRKDWFQKVMAEARTGINPQDATEFGDVLVFIHGYNNPQKIVMQRHRQLKADLRAIGYQGSVVSFDWPVPIKRCSIWMTVQKPRPPRWRWWMARLPTSSICRYPTAASTSTCSDTRRVRM